MSRDGRSSASLMRIVRRYIQTLVEGGRDGQSELEVRFGTIGTPTTRAKYQSVISRLLGSGFTSASESYKLNCIAEGEGSRVEIEGLQAIQIYCDSDDVARVKSNLTVTKKEPMVIDGTVVGKEDFPEFGFRAALSLERDITESQEARELFSRWPSLSKQFRLIHRFRFTHEAVGINVDMSIVKQSSKKSSKFIDSITSSADERYEIELEIDNSRMSMYPDEDTLLTAIKSLIKLVLSGLQSSNYPISISEGKKVLSEYMDLLWDKSYNYPVGPKNFVGPSSVSLQRSNLSEPDPNLSVPSVRNNYALTDKADGSRALLFVASDLKIYLITTSMDVQFTGTVSSNPTLIGTLLDGEHISNSKDGTFINLYAVFDVYYIGKKDVRGLPFMGDSKSNRLSLMEDAVKQLGVKGLVTEIAPMRIETKKFYSPSDGKSVFDIAAYLIARLPSFEYETDGIIFTPINSGVGTPIGKYRKPLKFTWDESLKWKPSQFNTIDFLVTFQKRPDGLPNVKTVFQQGLNSTKANEITEFQPVVLRVGFDENRHGYINPCKDVIDQKWQVDRNTADQTYKPVQFFPSNPPDSSAGLGNFLLTSNQSGGKDPLSEAGEVIEDGMIVECRYDLEKKDGWKWVPMRVRYDKTAELRAGKKNFGNAYHVADSNWHSIHNPVTVDMLSTGQGIPSQLVGEDVYYSRIKGRSTTVALRNFHNLYVKRSLILAITRPKQTLIDLAVGQGGDIPKWIAADLQFVLGIDVSTDNIENRLNGVCARYLNYAKKSKSIPKAVFLVGNSAVNIRSGEGIESDKGKMIIQALFGAKKTTHLGKTVDENNGIAQKGFDVCSTQFAIHYMFENPTTLNNFLRNVAETTKVGGYFVCTAYDGDKVFQLLRNKSVNQSMVINSRGKRMWEVTKRYTRDNFPDNTTALGYAIDVFQESIGKTFREYLVKFSYLSRVLEEYGFKPVSQQEANEMGLQSGTGNFELLYDTMMRELQTNVKGRSDYGKAPSMSPGEKKVSFLNRYAIFKKVSVVDARRVSFMNVNTEVEDEQIERETKEGAKEGNLMADALKPRKVKRKLKLKVRPLTTDEKS